MTKVNVQIGKRSEVFVLAETNAPRAYDYGYCIELYDATVSGRTSRYILLPEVSVEYQRGRNASGLHSLVTEGLLLDSEDMAQRLWQRLYGEDQG